MIRQNRDKQPKQFQQQLHKRPVWKEEDRPYKNKPEGEPLRTGGGVGYSHGVFYNAHTPGQAQGRSKQSVTCFGCGKQGYYHSEYTQKMITLSRITSHGPEASRYVLEGQVNRWNFRLMKSKQLMDEHIGQYNLLVRGPNHSLLPGFMWKKLIRSTQ